MGFHEEGSEGGGKEKDQKAAAKDESILAGQGLTFKTRESAETTSTMIPVKPPVIRAKDWKDLNEKLSSSMGTDPSRLSGSTETLLLVTVGHHEGQQAQGQVPRVERALQAPCL